MLDKMNNFSIGSKVWWFDYEASSTNAMYPKWLNLKNGTVVWMKDDEEILHAYIPGKEEIFVLLDCKNYIFETKEAAIESMMLRVKDL